MFEAVNMPQLQPPCGDCLPVKQPCSLGRMQQRKHPVGSAKSAWIGRESREVSEVFRTRADLKFCCRAAVLCQGLLCLLCRVALVSLLY